MAHTKRGVLRHSRRRKFTRRKGKTFNRPHVADKRTQPLLPAIKSPVAPGNPTRGPRGDAVESLRHDAAGRQLSTTPPPMPRVGYKSPQKKRVLTPTALLTPQFGNRTRPLIYRTAGDTKSVALITQIARRPRGRRAPITRRTMSRSPTTGPKPNKRPRRRTFLIRLPPVTAAGRRAIDALLTEKGAPISSTARGQCPRRVGDPRLFQGRARGLKRVLHPTAKGDQIRLRDLCVAALAVAS